MLLIDVSLHTTQKERKTCGQILIPFSLKEEVYHATGCSSDLMDYIRKLIIS